MQFSNLWNQYFQIPKKKDNFHRLVVSPIYHRFIPEYILIRKMHDVLHSGRISLTFTLVACQQIELQTRQKHQYQQRKTFNYTHSLWKSFSKILYDAPARDNIVKNIELWRDWLRSQLPPPMEETVQFFANEEFVTHKHLMASGTLKLL